MIGRANCPFCKRIATEEYDMAWLGAVTFEPINPVTPGHRLFVPRWHEDLLDDMYRQSLAPSDTEEIYLAQSRGIGSVFPLFYKWRRQERLTGAFNLILNAGEDATQSIQHTHLHYVPRKPNDGLVLPWTNQIKEVIS